MEKSVGIEPTRETIKVEAEFSVKLQQPQSKSLISLKNEEQDLSIQLENLKKENFSLKASIQAWKATFEQKQAELGEVESKLNEIYHQIWSEREEFCNRTNKFNNEYGILSKRFKEKVDKIFNPLLQKGDEKHEEGQNFKMKMKEAQEEVEILEKEDQSFEIFEIESQKAESSILNRNEAPKESSPEPDNTKYAPPAQANRVTESPTAISGPGTIELNEVTEKLVSSECQTNREEMEPDFSEINTEITKKKKVRFSKENETINIFYENPATLKMKFFSIIDTETVRKANRFKNMRKNQFLCQSKKSRGKFV